MRTDTDLARNRPPLAAAPFVLHITLPRNARGSIVAAEVIGTRLFRMRGLGNPFVYVDVLPD